MQNPLIEGILCCMTNQTELNLSESLNVKLLMQNEYVAIIFTHQCLCFYEKYHVDNEETKLLAAKHVFHFITNWH